MKYKITVTENKIKKSTNIIAESEELAINRGICKLYGKNVWFNNNNETGFGALYKSKFRSGDGIVNDKISGRVCVDCELINK